MPTDTGTQGWDSRFDDSTGPANSSLSGVSTPKQEASSILQNITITVRNELSFIPPNQLKFYSRLGQGSSFQVTQELFTPLNDSPYYVAVKRILMETTSTEAGESDTEWQGISKRLTNIMREVRILTHPKLRSHVFLVSAIGWGWAPDTFGAERPYLIMPFSASGTLSRFARKRILSITDRRLLVLDVALGLRALHENRIIHGDVKPENVLVFADFGCTVFEEDLIRTNEYYLGTAKYNAPEIRGLFKTGLEKLHQDIPQFDRFKAADCYSFGLLLWETIKKGQSFIESNWLEPGEHTRDFLGQKFEGKDDALLDHATTFFLRLQTDLATIEEEEDNALTDITRPNPTRAQLDVYLRSWPHASEQLDDIDAPPEAGTFQALQDAVALCLRDDLLKRGSIQQIVKTLSEGLKLDDKNISGWSSTVRHQPPTVNVNGSSPMGRSEKGLLFGFNHLALVDKGPTVRHLFLDPGSSLNVKVVPKDVPPDPAKQVTRVAPSRRRETITLTPQRYRYDGEDMFNGSMGRQPPWHVQCEAADMIQRSVESEKDTERSSQAKLQLALMSKIGYGMPPDASKTMQYLQEASDHNEVARAIYTRVHPTLDPEAYKRATSTAGAIPDHITYRNPLIYHGNVTWRDAPVGGDGFLNLGPISVASAQVLSSLLKKGHYGDFEICKALTAACRDGLFDEAMLLAKHCADMSPVDPEMPNPLHWLIMFSPFEATHILKALVSSLKKFEINDKRKGIQYLLAEEPELITVMLPYRGLTLHGTPLHWAVVAGYHELCEAFIHLGADVNVRNQCHRVILDDSQHEFHPSLSPLDLAAAGHHAQITKLLLYHGGEIYGGDWHWEHSPLHMIGYDSMLFSRYIMHGQDHRGALRETIQVLLSRGLDIDVLDSLNQTPLLRAVKSLDIEPYVLEELISGGARAVEESEEDEGTLVSSAVVCCAHRRYSAWKIPLLLPLIRDVNEGTMEHRGLNPLHYCAIFDAVPAAEILLRTPGIDANAESKFGDTAVRLAAQRGSLGTLSSLISHGADLTRHGIAENAIAAGQIDALAMLLNAGMSTRLDKLASLTVLHYAARHHSQRRSYIRKCLETCPQLRQKEILNDSLKHQGATPLHNAAYLGDLDGVMALVEAGANPLLLKADFTGEPKEMTALQVAKATKVSQERPTSATHSTLRTEIDEVTDFPGTGKLIRAIEIHFLDRMTEIIRVLEKAERSWSNSQTAEL